MRTLGHSKGFFCAVLVEPDTHLVAVSLTLWKVPPWRGDIPGTIEHILLTLAPLFRLARDDAKDFLSFHGVRATTEQEITSITMPPTTSPEFPPAETQKSNTALILGIVLLVVLAVAAIYYFVLPMTATPAPESVNTATAPTTESADTASLGGEIYTKAANPIDGDLPDNSAPNANPINDAYKNPFN